MASHLNIFLFIPLHVGSIGALDPSTSSVISHVLSLDQGYQDTYQDLTTFAELTIDPIASLPPNFTVCSASISQPYWWMVSKITLRCLAMMGLPLLLLIFGMPV